MSKRSSLKHSHLEAIVSELPTPPRKAISFFPKTDSQKELCEKIEYNDIVFVIGPAGTGKTFVSGMVAARELNSGNIDKIVVTRPAVEVDGEKMGFLPGELEEKFAPWFEPFRDVFEKAMGAGPLKYNMKKGVDKVVPTPMAYMRGSSYDNTWIIMDEAQNCTKEQMKMLLTRIGKDSKVIILGDVKQSDIHGVSGLEDAIRRLDGIPGIAFHEFTKDDIVRHGIIRSILERYES